MLKSSAKAAGPAHDRAIEAAARPISDMEKALAGSQKTLTAAVEAAITAITTLLDVAAAHDALVAESSATLRAHDVLADWREGDTARFFDTGAGDDGSVLLGGTAWTRVDAKDLVSLALASALRARYETLPPKLARHQLVADQLLKTAGTLLSKVRWPRPFARKRTAEEIAERDLMRDAMGARREQASKELVSRLRGASHRELAELEERIGKQGVERLLRGEAV